MKKQVNRRAPAKRKPAVKASRRLHVVHPKHTGKLLPHAHTSYPALGMVLLLVGVFLFGWTIFVNADDYDVHASVAGNAPTVAAVIDAPTDGKVLSSQLVTVSGTCPVGTYETLYRNGTFSGVSNCSSGGTYQIQTSLFVGANQLSVRDFSMTDEVGPLSNIVTVTYQPPAPPTNGGTSSSGSGGSTSSPTTSVASKPTTSSPGVSAPAADPLLIKSNFNYQGYYTGEPTAWQVDLEGGTAPYEVSIDWGDGTSSTISQPHNGVLIANHTYKKASDTNYVVKFTVTDAAGLKTLLQLIAIINDPPALTAANSTSGIPPTGSDKSGDSSSPLAPIMKYIVPTYGVTTLMLGSFWMGSHLGLTHVGVHVASQTGAHGRLRIRKPRRF